MVYCRINKFSHRTVRHKDCETEPRPGVGSLNSYAHQSPHDTVSCLELPGVVKPLVNFLFEGTVNTLSPVSMSYVTSSCLRRGQDRRGQENQKKKQLRIFQERGIVIEVASKLFP